MSDIDVTVPTVDLSSAAYDELATKLTGSLQRRSFRCSFIKDQLRDAVPVAKVDPKNTTFVALPLNPSRQGYSFIDIRQF